MTAFAFICAFASIAADGEAEPAPVDSDQIIVTGERVPRTVRETPSSVSVATSRDIEAMAAFDRVDQILDLVPNVQLGGGGDGPTIRGQDTTGPTRDLPALLGGVRPRTTLIVDGRPVDYSEFVSGVSPLWDVDRVEVFRSPQTTTQGQNSIAGAIFVYTQDPSTTVTERRVRAIVGEAHTRQISGVISTPIVDDQLAIRISGDYRYSHPSSDIRDQVPGADADHDSYGLVRFKLLATPKALPDGRLELTYAHTESEMPQYELIRGDFHKRQDWSGFAGIFRTNIDSLTGSFRYDLSSRLAANAIFTRGVADMRRFTLPGFGQVEINTRDWSVETVMSWSPNGLFRAIGGFSRNHRNLRQHLRPVLLVGAGEFTDDQDGTGLFAEGRFSLSEEASFTAGIRYQRDSQTRRGLLGSGASDLELDYHRTFEKLLPKIAFDYDFTPNFNAGVLAQRAYNPGGVTLRPDIRAADPYDAETLWDYELFARASFAGGKIRASANLFFYDMRDAQRSQPYFVQGVGLADLFNAPKARSYGGEGLLQWSSTRSFSASFAVGLLHTRIVRAGASHASFDGNEFQRAPHFSASASAEWRPAEHLLLSAQARHSGGYWSDDANSPLRRVQAWTYLDVRAEWGTDRLKLFGYARNVLNTFYLTYKFNPLIVTAGDPRELGVGLQGEF